MTPTPENRAATIFAAAVELPPGDRENHIVRACENDAALLDEIRVLIAAHEEAPTQFLAAPAADHFSESDLELGATIDADGSGRTSGRPASPSPATTTPSPSLTEREGDVMGPYKLLQQIGEGGFGTVWMAEQSKPISRKVALKVIKAGMDTKEVLSRFEVERQALAMMDHPNIAKVLEAGATKTGRPYFAMELVKGIPITKYCDEGEVTTRERLRLFNDVCSAINHAHQKGIIHRDIKPSNVMITLHGDKPVVKVIDFGIAKATQGKLTDQTLFTRYEQFLGTPVYMSPEQAAMSGLDIDTRSDIYALGILLYELLTGKPPFDSQSLLSAGYDEMRRIIREVEPVKPSSKLSTVVGEERTQLAKARHVEPEKLDRTVEPDLDWIVMKAIEKDRSRRYETANGLALDIARFLADEPVSATPPSAGYRLRKFARRHRTAFQVAAAIVLLLLGASIVSSFLAVQASLARDAAETERAKAQAETLRASESEQREALLRVGAEEQELDARRRAYAADMLLCQQALASNNLREARQLLDHQRPAEGEEDLRGWEWRRLWKSCQSGALYELGEHEGRILRAVYANDGETVVTYGDRGLVHRWNLDTRKGVTLQEGRKKSLLKSNSGFMCVSENRSQVAAVGANGDGGFFVQVWNFSLEAAPRIFSLGKERATAVAISPDGATLAAFLPENGVAWLWDIASGEKKAGSVEMMHHTGIYGAIQFSADGETLAVGGKHGQVRLMDVKNWTMDDEFTVNKKQSIKTLEFSPDGRFIACGSGFVDPRIFIWDLEKGEMARVLHGHAGFIACLAFSPDPDSSVLASASGDQTVKLWDTQTWEERTTLLGHTDEVWSVDFSPDGEKLISSGRDQRVQVWSMVDLPEHGGTTPPVPEGFSSSGESPDDRKLVAVSEGVVHLVGDATPVMLDELGANNVSAFWMNSDEIVVGARDPIEIKVWNAGSKQVRRFPLAVESAFEEIVYSYIPASRILGVAATHENGEDFTFLRWDLDNHRTLSSCVVPIKDLKNRHSTRISQDTRWLAVHTWTTVDIYDAINGTRKTTLEIDTEEGILGMALSPDGSQLAASTKDSPEIMIWELDTGKLEHTIHGHNLVTPFLAYSQDGTRLLSGAIGREPVKIWDTWSWQEVSRLEPLPGHLFTGPRFLSDGNDIGAVEHDLETEEMRYRHWRSPSWEAIEKAETDEIWK